MSLLIHAEKELELMGMGRNTKDPMNKLMHDNIIEMIKTFSKQGHSGFSASYAIGIVTKLMNYEPLRQLTGEDDEWNDVSEMSGVTMFQNKRSSGVFKDGKDGRAYDINAIIFRRGKEGSTFTKGGHRHYISFPYTPSQKIITIPKWQFWR